MRSARLQGQVEDSVSAFDGRTCKYLPESPDPQAMEGRLQQILQGAALRAGHLEAAQNLAAAAVAVGRARRVVGDALLVGALAAGALRRAGPLAREADDVAGLSVPRSKHAQEAALKIPLGSFAPV